MLAQRAVLVDALGPCPGLGREFPPCCSSQLLKLSLSGPVNQQLRGWGLDEKVGWGSSRVSDNSHVLLHPRSLERAVGNSLTLSQHHHPLPQHDLSLH